MKRVETPTIIRALEDMNRKEIDLNKIELYYGVTIAKLAKTLCGKINANFDNSNISIAIQILLVTGNKRLIKQIVKYLTYELNNDNNYTGYFEEQVAIAIQELILNDILNDGVALSAILGDLEKKGLTLHSDTVQNKNNILTVSNSQYHSRF